MKQIQLTEEQHMIREMARRFAETELKPIAAEIDQKGEYPVEMFSKMAEVGFMGLTVPADLGGAGVDTVCYSIVIEEISRVCASTGLSVAAHNSLGMTPILLGGSEEQKTKYLPELASGRAIGSFCLTEPEAGSDAAGIKTRAELKGDKYFLTGTKIYVTNGGFARYLVATAVTDPDAGPNGISAFIIHNDFPGFQVGTIERKLGCRASCTAEIVLDGCEVPKENLLGGAGGTGFKTFMKTLDGGRVSIGAMALGIGHGALDEGSAYAKTAISSANRCLSFRRSSTCSPPSRRKYTRRASWCTTPAVSRIRVSRSAWKLRWASSSPRRWPFARATRRFRFMVAMVTPRSTR
jgi:alkylation response protein AidB-like acyl-CoA dehydrogenase